MFRALILLLLTAIAGWLISIWVGIDISLGPCRLTSSHGLIGGEIITDATGDHDGTWYHLGARQLFYDDGEYPPDFFLHSDVPHAVGGWGFGAAWDTAASGGGFWFEFCLPWWFVCLLLGLMVTWGVRARRRWVGHACTKCGYDLRGNESGRCPECGQTIASSSTLNA
jgi:hypothetical protein